MSVATDSASLQTLAEEQTIRIRTDPVWFLKEAFNIDLDIWQEEMFEAMADGLSSLLSVERFLFLAFGVVVGMALGAIPGLGGIVGLALLLPFTFDMDATAAIAMLVALSSVTVTTDTIPSVLFAVPGTVGSQATILDGHPMHQFWTI